MLLSHYWEFNAFTFDEFDALYRNARGFPFIALEFAKYVWLVVIYNPWSRTKHHVSKLAGNNCAVSYIIRVHSRFHHIITRFPLYSWSSKFQDFCSLGIGMGTWKFGVEKVNWQLTITTFHFRLSSFRSVNLRTHFWNVDVWDETRI